MSKLSSNTKILAEGSIIIALTVILKDVLPPVFSLPQGGSVSLAGMVPLLWFSLRRDLRAGLEASAIYGLVNMALPGSFVVDPVQALLDYPIAFGALGLAGLFHKYPTKGVLRPMAGVALGITGRFLAHFASGVWFFAEYAPVGTSPVVYSVVYNGGYLIVELIVSEIIVVILVWRKTLDIFL